MKLKETTIDQRLCAGLLSIIMFGYGFLTVGEIHSKFEQFCHMESAVGQELTVMSLYVLLGTLGMGLGVLHLLSWMKFRKR
jgi:hypothetical protein